LFYFKSKPHYTWCLVLLLACWIPSRDVRAAEPIVLGLTADILSIMEGVPVKQATEATVDDVNERGGVLGRRLKVVVLNDGGDPARARANATALVREHGAVALLNCLGDETCEAVAEAAARANVPLIGPMAGARSLSRESGNPYVFRVRAGYDRMAEVMAKQLIAASVRKAAIISDAPTAERAAQFRKHLSAAGVATEVVPLTGKTKADREAMLRVLAAGNFHAALIDLRRDQMQALVDEGLDQRPEWPFTLLPISAASAAPMMGGFGQRLVGLVSVVPDPERLALPIAADMDRASRRGDRTAMATTDGFEAYINTKLVVEAIRRAGRADPAAIKATLEKMSNVDLGGFFVSFDKGRASGSNLVEVMLRARSSR